MILRGRKPCVTWESTMFAIAALIVVMTAIFVGWVLSKLCDNPCLGVKNVLKPPSRVRHCLSMCRQFRLAAKKSRRRRRRRRGRRRLPAMLAATAFQRRRSSSETAPPSPTSEGHVPSIVPAKVVYRQGKNGEQIPTLVGAGPPFPACNNSDNEQRSPPLVGCNYFFPRRPCLSLSDQDLEPIHPVQQLIRPDKGWQKFRSMFRNAGSAPSRLADIAEATCESREQVEDFEADLFESIQMSTRVFQEDSSDEESDDEDGAHLRIHVEETQF